jgi:heptosyltransferase-1
VDIDLSGASSVLIVKPSSLGDIVHTIPAGALISRAFPSLELRWVVNPEWAPLIEGLPWLTGIIPFPRAGFRGPAGLARFFSWRHTLRKSLPAKPDAALDFQGLLRSGLVSEWSGAPVRVGLSDSREGARFFHTNIVEVDRDAHAVDRYLAVPRAMGIDVPAALPWELPAGDPVPEDWLRGTKTGDCVLLHPFSRGQGKSMTADQVVAFCKSLEGQPVVIVGKGEPVAGLPANAIDLLDRTSLPQLIWLSRQAKFVVSIDSGPMHIAAAVNPNVLGIHTWSDPCKVGPYPAEAWAFKAGQFFQRKDCADNLRDVRAMIMNEDISAIAQFVSQRLLM